MGYFRISPQFASVTLEFTLSKNPRNFFWPPCCVHSDLTPEAQTLSLIRDLTKVSNSPWTWSSFCFSFFNGWHHFYLDSCQNQKLGGNSNFCPFSKIHSLIVSYLFCLLNLCTFSAIISSTTFTTFIGPCYLSLKLLEQ